MMDRGRKRSEAPRRKRIVGVTRDRRDGVNRFKGHPGYFRAQTETAAPAEKPAAVSGREATPPSSGDTLLHRA